MDSGTKPLGEKARKALRTLLQRDAGNLREFGKKMFPIQYNGREPNPDQEYAMYKRLLRIVSHGKSQGKSTGRLSAKNGNLIARVLEISYEELIEKLRGPLSTPPGIPVTEPLNSAFSAAALASGPRQINPTDYSWTKLKRELARSYLPKVSKACSSIRFPGLSRDESLALFDVYTELYVREGPEEGADPDRLAADRERLIADGALRSNETLVYAVPVFKAIAENSRLVVLGHAGGGKTTCLRYLAHCIAENLRNPKGKAAFHLKREGVENKLLDFVPVWVELKLIFSEKMPFCAGEPDCRKEGRKPDPSWLWDRILSFITAKYGYGKHDASMLLQARNEGRCWFFFDGLDEITDQDKRNFLQKQVGGFISQWCRHSPDGSPAKDDFQNRIVITCREFSWDRGWALPEWSSRLIRVIIRLNLEQQIMLVTRLFTASGFLPADVATNTPVANHMLKQLEHALVYGEVSDMAGVPLTLTMLAWLAARNRSLPRTRAALYEQVIYALLWLIEEEKGLPGQSLPKLLEEKNVGREAFTSVLCQLAYDTQERSPFGGEPILHMEDLQNPIATLAVASGEQAPGDAEESWALKVVRTLQLRAGVLREEGADAKGRNSFRFMHRSFQEFLAGVHLARQGNMEQLALGWARRDTESPKLPTAEINRLRQTEPTHPWPTSWEDLEMNTIRLKWERQRYASRENLWEMLRLACGYLAAPWVVREQLKLPGDLRIESNTNSTPFLFRSELSRNNYRRTPDAAYRLIMKLTQHGVEARHVIWEDVWLAGDLLEQLEPDQHPDLETPDWAGLKRNIRGKLVELIEAGALWPRERADVGSRLGRLGDPRSSVGVLDEGLPDIIFEPVGAVLPAGNFKCLPRTTTDIIEAPYQISRYPVTVAQFQAFVRDKGYQNKRSIKEGGFWPEELWWYGSDDDRKVVVLKSDGPGDKDYEPGVRTANHPQVGVTWYEASAFCAWLSKKLNQIIRLPIEAEWEQAARWNRQEGKADIRQFPCGDLNHQDLWQRMNMARLMPSESTCAVGIFPSTKAECGAYDFGSLWEWCGDDDDTEIGHRSVRGGIWYDLQDLNSVRPSSPRDRSPAIGFRCVVVH